MPDDQRAPDGEAQLLALAEAEAAGTLPDADRRDGLTADAALLLGYEIFLDTNGYHVTSPDGEYGTGASVHDAVLNIGAQILPNAETQRRELIRRDGTVIPL